MVERTIEALGIEHVALGSDSTYGQPAAFFQWLVAGNWSREPTIKEVPPVPPWAQGPADFVKILEALAARGLTDVELRAIAGENWLRLLDGVQGVAQ
jgi:microsomal dipeptidase-like Zn-dependent dipeptidase